MCIHVVLAKYSQAGDRSFHQRLDSFCESPRSPTMWVVSPFSRTSKCEIANIVMKRPKDVGELDVEEETRWRSDLKIFAMLGDSKTVCGLFGC